MNAATLASRAVVSAYARRVLRPIKIGAVVLFVLFLVVTIYLASAVSPWWWLFLIVVGSYGVFGATLWLIIRFGLHKLTPAQTADQTQAVTAFLDTSEVVAATLGISRFGFILRIIRDILTRRTTNIIGEFAKDSYDVKRSFEQVINSFR